MPAVLDMPPATTATNGSVVPTRSLPTLVEQRLEIRRISVKEYDLMIKHGILTKYDGVELLNGLLINTMPKGSPHSSSTDRATRCFYRQLDDNVMVRNQNPIHLDEFSEPEPDLVLAIPDEQDYGARHPTPAEILLIVEVSDSTLAFDRATKGLAYARAGIAQYLVFNIPGRSIEDYREPDADGYRNRQTYTDGQSFSLLAFPDIGFNVSDLLPLPTNREETAL